MNVFNEYKNKYFKCFQNLINDMNTGKTFTDNDIREFIRNETFNEIEFELEDKIFNITEADSEEMVLFERNIDNQLVPMLDSKIPIRITRPELQWLKMLVEDSINRVNLDKTIVDKLKNGLEDIEGIDISHWVKKFIKKDGDEITDDLIEKIHKLTIAIKENKYVLCNSFDQYGNEYNGKVHLPYKIEYSIRENMFRVSVISVEKGDKVYKNVRPVKINIRNITSLEILNNAVCENYEEAISMIKKKKNINEPIVLKIKDRNNAVERCFSLFSYYDKKAYYNKEKDEYTIEIYCYGFEETEIIQDILALGSYVVVGSPKRIRDKVIEDIKSCLTSD